MARPSLHPSAKYKQPRNAFRCSLAQTGFAALGQALPGDVQAALDSYLGGWHPLNRALPFLNR